MSEPAAAQNQDDTSNDLQQGAQAPLQAVQAEPHTEPQAETQPETQTLPVAPAPAPAPIQPEAGIAVDDSTSDYSEEMYVRSEHSATL